MGLDVFGVLPGPARLRAGQVGDGMIIEHDPNETPRRRSPLIYWVAWLMIVLLWVGQWYFDGLDWEQILLGFITGAMITAWAIEITGNKMPDSWGGK